MPGYQFPNIITNAYPTRGLIPGTYQLTKNDGIFSANAAAGLIHVTLPLAVTVLGMQFWMICVTNPGVNSASFECTGGELFNDLSGSITVNTQWSIAWIMAYKSGAWFGKVIA